MRATQQAAIITEAGKPPSLARRARTRFPFSGGCECPKHCCPSSRRNTPPKPTLALPRDARVATCLNFRLWFFEGENRHAEGPSASHRPVRVGGATRAKTSSCSPSGSPRSPRRIARATSRRLLAASWLAHPATKGDRTGQPWRRSAEPYRRPALFSNRPATRNARWQRLPPVLSRCLLATKQQGFFRKTPPAQKSLH